jgi:uncharacterized HAD superfamily protein
MTDNGNPLFIKNKCVIADKDNLLIIKEPVYTVPSILKPVRKCMVQNICDWCGNKSTSEYYIETICGWFWCDNSICMGNAELSINDWYGSKRLINVLPWLLDKPNTNNITDYIIDDTSSLVNKCLSEFTKNDYIIDKHILVPNNNYYNFMRKRTNKIENGILGQFIQFTKIATIHCDRNNRLYTIISFDNDSVKHISIANLFKYNKNYSLEQIGLRIDKIKENWNEIMDTYELHGTHIDRYRNISDAYKDFYIDRLRNELKLAYEDIYE